MQNVCPQASVHGARSGSRQMEQWSCSSKVSMLGKVAQDFQDFDDPEAVGFATRTR